MDDKTHIRRLDEPEFPGFANVFESTGEAEPIDADPAAAALNRRSFLALSTATALAAAAGCRRPDLQILPYSAIPDDQIGHIAPGRPTFYATAIPRPGGALPVLVESHDGRPTKIEGNPKHPASQGSTDAFAQASILDLYSPDRVMSDKYPGVMETRRAAHLGRLRPLRSHARRRFAKTQGEGLYILTDQTPSPSLRLIREHVKKTLPKASWHTYEPVNNEEALQGRGDRLRAEARREVQLRQDRHASSRSTATSSVAIPTRSSTAARSRRGGRSRSPTTDEPAVRRRDRRTR